MLANLVIYLSFFFTFGRTGVCGMEGTGSSGHLRRSEVDGILLDGLEAGMIRSRWKEIPTSETKWVAKLRLLRKQQTEAKKKQNSMKKNHELDRI